MTTYFVTVGGNEYKVDILNGQYTVNGERVDMGLRRLNEQGLFLLQRGNRLREVLMNWRNSDQVAMVTNRRHVTVQVARDGSPRKQKNGSKGDLAAPMPGIVVEMRVKENQRVEKGQVVAVMESMKMQMEIRAPSDGIIGKILAKVGGKIEKGTLLAQLTELPQPA